MDKKNLIYVAASVAALGAAAFLLFGFFAGGNGVDEGLNRPTWWVCKADGCENLFELTTGETLASFDQNDGHVACTVCGSFLTKPAYPCPYCKKLVESDDHGDPSPKCNHCGANLLRTFEHTHADGTTHTHGEVDESHEHEDEPAP